MTLVVFVSVKVVFVTLSVKVPSPVGGGGNSVDKSVPVAGLVTAPSSSFPALWMRTVTDRPLAASTYSEDFAGLICKSVSAA